MIAAKTLSGIVALTNGLAMTMLMGFSFSYPAHAEPPPPLVIDSAFTPPVSTIFRDVLAEVGRRINRKIIMQEMPGERALMLAETGIDDGDCCRIPQAVLRDYPELVTVPESVFQVRFVAFTRDPRIHIRRWNDLKPYSVGTVTGWKILVNNIGRVQPAYSVALDTPEAMFKMLAMGRIDVATYGYLSGEDVIGTLGLTDIHAQSPPLAIRDLYLMLNKRHRNLVDDTVRALAAMKQDGTLQRIIADNAGPKQE